MFVSRLRARARVCVQSAVRRAFCSFIRFAGDTKDNCVIRLTFHDLTGAKWYFWRFSARNVLARIMIHPDDVFIVNISL